MNYYMKLKILLNIERRTRQQIERALCLTSEKKAVREYSGGPLRDMREAIVDIMPLNTPRPPSPLFLPTHSVSSDFNRHFIEIF
jgi:hypothetical protein